MQLVKEIRTIIAKARYRAFTAINTHLLNAYFEIGKKIVEEEQMGSQRAGYGEMLLENISKELGDKFGRAVENAWRFTRSRPCEPLNSC